MGHPPLPVVASTKHVLVINIRAFFAVHFDGNEPAIEELGNRRIRI